jgi:hypothetical protein
MQVSDGSDMTEQLREPKTLGGFALFIARNRQANVVDARNWVASAQNGDPG